MYSGMNKQDARDFLNAVNVESTDGGAPTRNDRTKITENELRDFLQKVMTKSLDNCEKDPKCN